MTRSNAVVMAAVGVLLAMTILGCRDSSVTPFDPLPAGGTRLYIADCNPFIWQDPDREVVTLVPDPDDACNTLIDFYSGLTADWRSNTFRAPAGALLEGAHLVFHRDVNEASVVTVIAVSYSGLSTSFQRQLELPIGETISAVDLFETGEIVAGGDSGVVELSISILSGAATLNTFTTTGTYVQVGVERTSLCEFEIDLGLAGGIGQPGSGVVFSYRNAASEIHPSIFLDFTHGAQIDGSVLIFGPQYGLTYLAAESDGCSDTARFMAVAPAQGYRVDTLETVFRGNLLSDGNQVWFWEDRPLPDDSAACRAVNILYTNEWPLLSHPIYSCEDAVIAYCDAMSRHFWIILRSSSFPDTAWGYTLTGALDTTVIAQNIPDGFLYRGQWLNVISVDRYTRTVSATPFSNGTATTLGTYPAALTEAFGGGAGLGYPGTLDYEWWSVNVFDEDVNWIARYPIRGEESDLIGTVTLLTADSVIVYAANIFNVYYVRALHPQ
ncbi:MAG: hypothetical protein PHI18_01160 [bacterium]|nr:hypothetical protein [bacterium]